MEIQGIDDFLTLVETRSFSKAAAQRHVTQPAFSRRIKALEENLGTPLFDRSKTPLALTSMGEHFFQHAQTLANISRAVIDDMQSRATMIPQALRIEMSNSLSSVFFPLWYKHLQRKIPKLLFRLMHQKSRESLNDLRSGRTDFAIHLNIPKIKRNFDYYGLQQRVIDHDKLVFVKAATAKKDTLSLITHGSGSYINSCIEKFLGSKRFNAMKVVFESPTSEISRGLVLAGFGSALISENLVKSDLDDGYMILAAPRLKPLKTEIVLLRSEKKLSPLAEAVWENCLMPEKQD